MALGAEGPPGSGAQGAGLTGLVAIALVADSPQAVEALADVPQLVLQLGVAHLQRVLLDAAHVNGADDVFVDFCGSQRQEV